MPIQNAKDNVEMEVELTKEIVKRRTEMEVELTEEIVRHQFQDFHYKPEFRYRPRFPL